LSEKDIQASDYYQGDLVKTLLTITSGVGIATLLFVGYVLLTAIPDVGRYVRISRM
jgi:hypothetical protein